jgi:hypothetical protein
VILVNGHLPPWKALVYEYAAKTVFYPIAIAGAAFVWLVVVLFAVIATAILLAVWPVAEVVSLFVSPSRVNIRK